MTDPNTLDRILELQFLVGWAGEANTDPPRIGWWRTDLVDEYGGYDLLQRLVPRTARWTQFELVRKAARLVDAVGLAKQADADSLRTIFHLDPELDGLLAERLRTHKRSERDPLEALPLLRNTETWDVNAFESFLSDTGEKRNFTSEPFGKRLVGDPPADILPLVRTLAQGLLPLTDDYSRPYAVVR